MHKCMILTCQYTCKIFSRKKSNRDTVQKQHTNKLNRSCHFYLLSIRSKKIDSSEFHKQIQDFELPTSWDFFWRAKKAGKHYQNVSLIPQILHAPFTCYHYILKKFTALHEQIHDFDLSIHFTFFLKRKKSRGKLHNHIAQSLNTSRPFYLWLIRSKKIYSSEFHKQIHDFDPFTPSLHNQLSNFNQGYLEEKNCFWVFQIGQCCIVT